MNRTTARRTAPALVALALALSVGGCSGETATETETPAPAESANAALCDGFAELQKSVEDLKSDPIDVTGTPEAVQEQVAEMSAKAATVKAQLSTLSALSDGPVAAAVGEMNQKADELNEQLTLAVTERQEEIGPMITAAQEELNAAYEDVTAKVETVCPPN